MNCNSIANNPQDDAILLNCARQAFQGRNKRDYLGESVALFFKQNPLKTYERADLVGRLNQYDVGELNKNIESVAHSRIGLKKDSSAKKRNLKKPTVQKIKDPRRPPDGSHPKIPTSSTMLVKVDVADLNAEDEEIIWI